MHWGAMIALCKQDLLKFVITQQNSLIGLRRKDYHNMDIHATRNAYTQTYYRIIQLTELGEPVPVELSERLLNLGAVLAHASNITEE